MYAPSPLAHAANVELPLRGRKKKQKGPRRARFRGASAAEPAGLVLLALGRKTRKETHSWTCMPRACVLEF